MKKLLFLSAIAILLAASQNKPEFTISGQVADTALEGQQVKLNQFSDGHMVIVDSSVVTDAKFHFKGNSETPTIHFLTIGEQNKRDAIRTLIVIEPGNINVSYESGFLNISGTNLNNAYNEFNTTEGEIKAKAMELSNQYSAAKENGTLTEELDQQIKAEYNKVVEDSKNLNFDFVKSNIDNILGEYHFFLGIATNMLEPNRQRELLSIASEEFKQDEDVARIIKQLEASEAVEIGKKFIDFTMEDPEGNSISLSDYAGKGKYVFVDFWAPWCGPCIAEMPNVVEAYKKYKDKGFEVIGVSIDSDKGKWLKAIEDLEMTWHNMSDLKGYESPVVKLYAILGIPYTVLLDKEGVIIAKNLRGNKLHDKLAELLD